MYDPLLRCYLAVSMPPCMGSMYHGRVCSIAPLPRRCRRSRARVRRCPQAFDADLLMNSVPGMPISHAPGRAVIAANGLMI